MAKTTFIATGDLFMTAEFRKRAIRVLKNCASVFFPTMSVSTIWK